MKRYLRGCAFIIIVCAVFLSVSPLWGAEDFIHVHRDTLPNGLEVYFTRNTASPEFYAEIAVKAGGKMDPEDATGIAHYLEHMLFKGSARLGTLDYEKEASILKLIEGLYTRHFNEKDPERRADIYRQIDELGIKAAQYAVPNEQDTLYRNIGGTNFNAHTGFEETVYKVNLPKNRLREWAMIESDRFLHPVFRLFQSELEVVFEEKNMSMDNRHNVLWENFRALMFQKHPYSRTVLGDISHIRNPSLKKMRAYYDTYYVPNNMAIVISGDLRWQEVRSTIRRYFTKWKVNPDVPVFEPPKEAPIESLRRATVTFPGEDAVAMGFYAPPTNHKDEYALDILSMLLTNSGGTGLIDINLNQAMRVLGAASFYASWKDYGFFGLYGRPKSGQTLAQVERLLIEQIEKVKKGEFSDALFEAMIVNIKKNWQTQMETNLGRVSTIRSAYLYDTPWSRVETYIDRLSAVTKEDVVKAANKYFGDQNYAAVYRKNGPPTLHGESKPSFTPVQTPEGENSRFFNTVLRVSPKPLRPIFVDVRKDIERDQTAQGIQISRVNNPINDIAEFTLRFEYGRLHDPRAPALMDALSKAGTATMSSAEFRQKMYSIGMTFNVRAMADFSYVELGGPEEYMAEAVALIADFFKNPSLDQGDFKQYVENIIKERSDSLNNPQTIMTAINDYLRRQTQSSYYMIVSNKDLRAMKFDETYSEVARAALGAPKSINYVGKMPMGEIKALAEKYFPEPRAREFAARSVYEMVAPKKSTVYYAEFPANQTLMGLTSPPIPFEGAEKLVFADLFNDYFPGMSGVFFQELRERRSMAYHVAAYLSRPYMKGDSGYLVGFIGTQMDKSIEALKAFVELLNESGFEKDRFESSRQAILDRQRSDRLGFRQILSTVEGWEDRGLVGFDPRERVFHGVRSIDVSEAQKLLDRYMHGRPYAVSLVGNISEINLEALKPDFDLQKVDLDEIIKW